MKEETKLATIAPTALSSKRKAFMRIASLRPCYDSNQRGSMKKTERLVSLLAAYEEQAAERAAALAVAEEGLKLDSALRDAELLVTALKEQAQAEQLSEQELKFVEQAAKLAETMAFLACQTVEIEAAKILSAQRQDFVATLTHDLKNPLIGANRLLELFIDGALGPINSQQAELLAELKNSNSASLMLINTLSDIYRYETNPGEINCEVLPLVPIVEVACNDLKNWATQSNFQTNLSAEENMQSVYIDGQAIKRLVDNLLGNAAKFAGPDGIVDISVASDDNNAVIEVHDNGVGIPAAERKHLFQRFSQGAVGKRYSGGSGLGLYLCRQIAQAHGGKIECVDSNQGTTFRVSLPIKTEPKVDVAE